VTSLEPRTPHQPGKLQNVSKNDYGFNTPIFYVNEIHAPVTAYSSTECRASTMGWHKDCANSLKGSRNRQYSCGFPGVLAHADRSKARITWHC